MRTMDGVWREALWSILCSGAEVSPRGIKTLERLQATVVVPVSHPVVTVKTRRLNYRFLAAEAYWILSGSNAVDEIVPYNSQLAKYSDDSTTFFGAYGPWVVGQLGYVVDKLREDPDTRQAVMTIWRQNPPATKDYPCTVAFSFMIRGGKLNVHGFMRSSDAWLGLPYDCFNFSMLGALVAGMVNGSNGKLELGNLYLTMASSHLYEQHFTAASELLKASDEPAYPAVPVELYQGEHAPALLLERLKALRDDKSLRWWA